MFVKSSFGCIFLATVVALKLYSVHDCIQFFLYIGSSQKINCIPKNTKTVLILPKLPYFLHPKKSYIYSKVKTLSSLKTLPVLYRLDVILISVGHWWLLFKPKRWTIGHIFFIIQNVNFPMEYIYTIFAIMEIFMFWNQGRTKSHN